MVKRRLRIRGYIWNEIYHKALRLLKEMQKELVEINRFPETTSERIVTLALLITETRDALVELNEIAKGNQKGEKDE